MATRQGLPAYQGYEYQLLVSSWLALLITVEREQSHRIDVEPASGEDIEALLDVSPDNACSTLNAGTEAKLLQFQVKLRRTGPWTVQAFMDVLDSKAAKTGTRGPSRRVRPIDALKRNPALCFYLITNAEVSSDLKSFVVDDIDQANTADQLPTKSRRKSKKDDPAEDVALASRVFIFEQCTPDRVEQWAAGILARHAHLPLTRVKDCLAALMQLARERLLGTKAPPLSIEELREVIIRHGGLPQPTPSLAAYVPPSNFSDLVASLEQDHVVLLSGIPGVGKTLTAEKLVWQHQMRDEPFEVVRPTSPSNIRSLLTTEGRIVFYIDDPWGPYRQVQDVGRWTSELPKLLDQAGPDKRFIVTTRTGLFQDAVGTVGAAPYTRYLHSIDAQHYDQPSRALILERHLFDARPWQKDFARVHRQAVIRQLTVPYSLAVFSRSLKRQRNGREVDLQTLLQQSTVETISNTVAREILERPDAAACAVVVWALLMANRGVSLEQLRAVSRAIRSTSSRYRLDLVEFVRWLSKGEWLKSNAKGEYEGHPRVLAGLELLVDSHPTLAEEVTEILLAALVTSGYLQTAHKVIISLSGRRLPIPESVEQAVNNYLIGRLISESEQEFSTAFHDASLWAKGDNPVPLVVKSLIPPQLQERTKPYGKLERWQSPTWTKTEWTMVRQSREAFIVAGRFVRLVLPHSHMWYDAEPLLAFLGDIGWDLSQDFYVAAKMVIGQSCLTHDVIVKGALSGAHPLYEELLTVTFQRLQEAVSWENEHLEELRQAEQAEIDAAYASHMDSEMGEQYQPVYNALDMLLALYRRREGLPSLWLSKFPRRKSQLVNAWANAINAEEPASREEVRSLLAACEQEDHRPVWKAIAASRCREFTPIILSALSAAPTEHLGEAIKMILYLEEAERVASVLQQSVMEAPFERRARITATCWRLDEEVNGKPIAALVAEALLTDEEQTALGVCRAVQDQRFDDEQAFPTLHTAHVDRLRILASSEPDVLAALAVRVLAMYDVDISAYIPRLLEAEDVDVRRHALVSVYESRIPELRAHLMAGLRDVHYRCRRVALQVLAPSASEPERQAVIALKSDPSAPVRKECATTIGEHRWEEGLRVLCELLRDKRNASEGRDVEFHVARVAAEALIEFEHLPPDIEDCVLDFVDQGADASEDVHVHYVLILHVLATANSPRVLPILRKCLMSRRQLAGLRSKAYPIRYAGTWALFEQLLNNRNLHATAPIKELAEAASDTDAPRAGPALLCLGVLGEAVSTELDVVLSGPESSPNRRMIAAAGRVLGDQGVSPQILIGLVPASHPGLSVLKWICDHFQADDAEWVNWITTEPEVGAWLKALQSGEDVNPYLRHALRRLSHNQLTAFLSDSDLHADDLPKFIKMISARSLGGGE